MLKDYAKKKPVIETNRLIIREYMPCDVASLKKWLGNDEIYKYWGRGPLEIEKNPELIFEGDGWPRGDGVIPDIRLVMVFKGNNEAVGEIQLYDIMEYSAAEVGYRLSPEYRGRGLAAEALRAVVDFAFTETELDKIHTLVAVENRKSGRVLLSAGFQHTDTVIHGRMIDQYCDYEIYELTRDDYETPRIRECESSKLGLYVWQDHYGIHDADTSEDAVFYSELKNSYIFSGEVRDIKGCVSELLKREGYLSFSRVSEPVKDAVESAFPGTFSFEEDEDSFDYLYDINDLVYLEGRKYSNKRNQINSFYKSCDNRWTAEPLCSDNLEECRLFMEKWYETRLPQLFDTDRELYDSLDAERKALRKVFSNYPYLKEKGAEGIMVKAEEKCIAFSLGDIVGDDTFDIVIEKADENVRGAYVAINTLFARYVKMRFDHIRFINRENDMGNPALRQAKKSYYPVRMLKKYTIEKNKG